MSGILARIYLAIALTLVGTGGVIYLALEGINRYRFHHYVVSTLDVPAELVAAGWSRQPQERREDWLQLVSSLFGVEWALTSGATDELSVDRSRWTSQEAMVRLPVGAGTRQSITGEINDWSQVGVGLGYLALNELSRTPPGDRPQELARLSERLPFDVTAVQIQASELGFLGRRQLLQGQAYVRGEHGWTGDTVDWVYVPMGGNQALRLGPVPRFNWLTPVGLVAGVTIVLSILGLALWLILMPLRRRLKAMTEAVDAIHSPSDRVHVPDQPRDELGAMGHHINEMAQRLQAQSRLNRDLNRAVSHDLKTPLARIKFALALADEEHSRADALSEARLAVDSLNDLISELLLYHSLDPALAEDECFSLSPDPMVHQVCDDLPESGRIERHTTRGPPVRTKLNEASLRRLVRNLLVNALRYGHHSVRVQAWMETNTWLCVVDDDGPGIPLGDRQRVLEPFVRLDKARTLGVGGHGLGLSICHSLVARAGGEMWLSDSDLGGLRVTLRLPTE